MVYGWPIRTSRWGAFKLKVLMVLMGEAWVAKRYTPPMENRPTIEPVPRTRRWDHGGEQ